MGIETPKLILGGDKRKARSWLGFAQQKLRQLKVIQGNARMMDGVQGLVGVQGVQGVHGVSAIINRMYKPVNGTKVLIKSFDGHDYINIYVQQGGLCDVNIRIDEQIDKEITIGVLYNPRQAQVDSELTGWQAFIDWGDGEGSFIGGAKGTEKKEDHEYAEEGKYTITVTAWNAKKLESGGSSSSPTTVVGWSKGGNGNVFENPAASHALAASMEWFETQLTTFKVVGVPKDKRIVFAKHSNEWEFHKTVMTIDLEGESTGKMIGMVVYSADIDAGFEYGELDPLHRPGIFKDGVLWHTIPNNHRRDRGDLYEYKLIGSLRNFKEMEFKDIGDYAFPAGDTWEPRSRDYFRMNATGLHYCTFHPYDCKAIKKKSITVPPEE